MAEVLKKFGRYFLLDHIAQGGMAEIYRARLASPDGAGRLMVIKRVIAGYGGNAEFLQMFKSEIKVTMGFNHPNIVQLYDFGEEQEQPFIAMELVDGKNLKQLMSRFSELKQSFPVDFATYIIEQAASGLHYAHSFKDKMTGEPLNIVHRDISPQNILISFEGNVKVIDFGIAKATTNIESTRAGIIKGKPSYLSPEQISGEVLDGRSDIFALGAVLWELLTGKKLFAGENDLAVLKLIESCQTHVKPPSTLNPKVPKELDYIVLKTLSKDREKRYQSAEDVQRALHKFLYTFSPDFNPPDLAYHAKELFKNDIVEDRKKLLKLNDKIEQILSSGTNTNAESASQVSSTPELQGSPSAEFESNPKLGKGMESYSLPTEGNDKVEMEVAPHSTQFTHHTQTQMQTPQHTRTFEVPAHTASQINIASPSSNRTHTHLSRRPQPQPISSNSSFIKPVGFAAILILGISYFGPQFGVRVPIVSDLVREKKESSPTSSKDRVVSSTEKSISVRISLSPAGGNPTITINSNQIDPNNPLIQVPLDAPLELKVERSGYKPFTREFTIDSKQAGNQVEWPIDVQLEPLHFGFLTIHSTPSADASTTLDGAIWTKKTPLENEKFPIGSYQIQLTNDILGMAKTINVTIEEGRINSVEEHLEVK